VTLLLDALGALCTVVAIAQLPASFYAIAKSARRQP
jgi:hypothetical protein